MSDKTYDDGVRDGKLEALEDITGKHSDRLDSHSKRLTLLERIMWAGGGIVAFIQLVPLIKPFLQ